MMLFDDQGNYIFNEGNYENDTCVVDLINEQVCSKYPDEWCIKNKKPKFPQNREDLAKEIEKNWNDYEPNKTELKSCLEGKYKENVDGLLYDIRCEKQEKRFDALDSKYGMSCIHLMVWCKNRKVNLRVLDLTQNNAMYCQFDPKFRMKTLMVLIANSHIYHIESDQFRQSQSQSRKKVAVAVVKNALERKSKVERDIIEIDFEKYYDNDYLANE